MSSNKCFPLFPTTNLEISTRRVLMQPEHDSPWLLPGACTHPVCMIVIFLIILLCCKVSLMHQLLHNVFPDVLSVCARTFVEINHDAIRNMSGVRYVTPRPCHVLIPWSPDHVISPPSHLVILALHIHVIIPMHVPCQFLEPIAETLISTHHCHVDLVLSLHQ
jgi:hypothetical protein